MTLTWQSLVFLIVAGGAFGFSGYRISILYRLLKAQKGAAKVYKNFQERILVTISNVLGQKAVLRKPVIGFVHALIFWGFIVITIGTLEQFAGTLFSGANFEFIGHAPYRGIVFMQDILAVAVLGAVLYAAYRRFVVRPPHLTLSRDANFILLFTGFLMLSILLVNAFLVAGTHPWFADAMPVANLLAGWFEGIAPETAATLSLIFKWIHMLIVLGFAMYIPGSKHLHILAAGPNTFLKNLPIEKPMRPIDFSNEAVTQYGAAKVTDLSWKDALDFYSCTECGRCQEVCPAWNTQKPLSPKNIIADLKHQLFDAKPHTLAGKFDEVKHVIDEHVTEDVIWACTSCRACEVACPVFIEQTDKIFDIRRNLVMMESRFPAEVQTVFKNMETNASPWAFPASDRANWAQGLGVQSMNEVSSPEGLDVLLWVGCAGSFDDRNKKVVTAFVNILKKAGIKFAMLGQEEQCTGDPARRIGNEYLYQTLAQANVETMNRYQVKRVVTTCPHCFNTIKNEYPQFGGNYQVQHHSQFIAQLINDGKIKPTKSMEETITYHDSCYLSRWNGETEKPRAILQAVPAARLVEMKTSKEKGLCCGAGGGRMWMEEKIGKRVNITRTEQALETKAGVVASACPFCMTMMNDGVKAKDMQDKVRVMDIAEIVNQTT